MEENLGVLMAYNFVAQPFLATLKKTRFYEFISIWIILG